MGRQSCFLFSKHSSRIIRIPARARLLEASQTRGQPLGNPASLSEQHRHDSKVLQTKWGYGTHEVSCDCHCDASSFLAAPSSKSSSWWSWSSNHEEAMEPFSKSFRLPNHWSVRGSNAHLPWPAWSSSLASASKAPKRGSKTLMMLVTVSNC